MQRLCILLILCSCRIASAQVILSEVMYNPRLNDNAYEFIEIFNASDTDTVSLFGWQIGDQNETDSLISRSAFYRLDPQQFAIVLDRDYFAATPIYDSFIPPQALILTINDNTLGSAGLSNSTAETVVLLDAAGKTAASYTYSLGNTDGVSDEKIFLKTDDASSNWANSLRPDGTPGQYNSVSPPAVDGELVARSFRFSPAALREGQTAKLNVTVRNAGLQEIPSAVVEFWITRSGTISALPLHLGSAETPSILKYTDTVRVDFAWNSIIAGQHDLVAIGVLPNDARPGNDTLRISMAVGHRRNTVLINEIMYAPPADQPEWIEVFNPQTTTVSLAEWQLEDDDENRGVIPPGVMIPPLGYLVLARNAAVAGAFRIADSLVVVPKNFPSLNNGGDVLLLRDFSDGVIDSVAYQENWGAPKISVEKILYEGDNIAANWRPSQDDRGGTPAALNSASPRDMDGELVSQTFQLSPAALREGQTAKLEVTVRNAGLQEIPSAAVEFWITGSSAALTLPLRLGSAEIPLTLKYTDTVRVGFEWESIIAGRHELAAILILPHDARPGNDTLQANSSIGHRRNTLLINEIMYEPPAGQPEWIEIFNPHSTAVPLTDWWIQDKDRRRGAVVRHVMVPAFGYLTLAEDSTVAEAFSIPDSLIIILNDFPSLNDNGDVLLLRDFSGAVIDSVAYQENWGAPRTSVEKVWYERDNASANWRPSEDPRRGTPAGLNSVSPRDIDLATIRLLFDPPQPAAGEDVHLITTVLNRGRRAVDRLVVTFFNDHNDDGLLQSGEEIGAATIAQTLPIEDSIVVRLLWSQPLSGRHQILAIVATPLDAVASNDHLSARLSVGYAAHSVVINEIYYAPRSDEVEWVELYNRGNQPVDLSTWRWRDAGADLPVLFPDSTLILAPGEFALLGAGRNISLANTRVRLIVPKTWLALNNDSEQLVLADFHGRLQDSLTYSQHWGGDDGGVSLERINPHLASTDSSNWSTCVDPFGSTPGKPNSIFTEFVPSQASVTASPQPFSPDDDGHDDVVIIQIQVPTTTATAHLKIYDVRGRLVHQLLNNTPVGAMHQVIWNGRVDNDRPVATGIYILYLQAINAAGGILVEARSTLVLARRLN